MAGAAGGFQEAVHEVPRVRITFGVRCAGKRSWRVWLALAGTLCLSGAAGATPPGCKDTLLQASRELAIPYSVRVGNYCDGTIPKENSGALELVSYSAGKIDFGAGQSVLNIQPMRAAGDHDSPVVVLGQDKRSGGNYRLDGQLASTRFLSVDLKSAILAKAITAQNLALLAWIDRGDGPVYLPVVAGAPSDGQGNAIAVLRASSAMIEVATQLCIGSAPCGSKTVVGKDLPAGSLISFEVPRITTPVEVKVKISSLGPAQQQDGFVLHLMAP